jgi:hypothetical protein
MSLFEIATLILLCAICGLLESIRARIVANGIVLHAIARTSFGDEFAKALDEVVKEKLK